jgi:hypothetical protein
MTKKLTGFLAAALFLASPLSATKIFLDYEADQDIGSIPDLKPVKDQKIFPRQIKVYEDENHQFFAFLNGKMKTVFVMYNHYDIKEEIEKILKNGFRLKQIIYKSRSTGQIKPKNVKELLQLVKKERDRDIVDAWFDATLTFENLEGVRVVMNVREAYERRMKKCVSCTYLDGQETKVFKVMSIFFSKPERKK